MVALTSRDIAWFNSTAKPSCYSIELLELVFVVDEQNELLFIAYNGIDRHKQLHKQINVILKINQKEIEKMATNIQNPVQNHHHHST